MKKAVPPLFRETSFIMNTAKNPTRMVLHFSSAGKQPLQSRRIHLQWAPKLGGGIKPIDSKLGKSSKLMWPEMRELTRFYIFTKLSLPEMSRVLRRFNGIHIAEAWRQGQAPATKHLSKIAQFGITSKLSHILNSNLSYPKTE